jgi:hypothetical protein
MPRQPWGERRGPAPDGLPGTRERNVAQRLFRAVSLCPERTKRTPRTRAVHGRPGGIRTHNMQIWSLPLYRWSYWPVAATAGCPASSAVSSVSSLDQRLLWTLARVGRVSALDGLEETIAARVVAKAERYKRLCSLNPASCQTQRYWRAARERWEPKDKGAVDLGSGSARAYPSQSGQCLTWSLCAPCACAQSGSTC